MNKKLYLKNGIELSVGVFSDQNGKEKTISVYIPGTDAIRYSIIMAGLFNNRRFRIPSGNQELKMYELIEAAEIAENFNQYFNNLNQ